MTAIAQLEENRTVEGVYAVARKERLRTKGGAPYLALELVDSSGRIEARVWNDVELLDQRFAAADVDPATMAPALRRDAAELEGFLEFLVAEIVNEPLRALVTRALAQAPLQ